MRNYFVIILTGIALVSCAPKKKNIVTRLNKTVERSAEYRYGYMDGCGTRLSMKGGTNHLHFKDLNRYNGEYKLGWDDGYRKCRK